MPSNPSRKKKPRKPSGPWYMRARLALEKSSADNRNPAQTSEERLVWDISVIKAMRELKGFEKGLNHLESVVFVMKQNPTMSRKALLDYAEGLLKETQERVAKNGIP